MKTIPVAATTAAILLGACTTPVDSEGEPVGECDATSVQGLIGERASEVIGARLLGETGARQLRWVPPDTAVTMDFRPDRLTVSYDANMVIERISCG